MEDIGGAILQGRAAGRTIGLTESNHEHGPNRRRETTMRDELVIVYHLENEMSTRQVAAETGWSE